MSRTKQLTVRFDKELDLRVRSLARREHISLNEAALRLLRKGAGIEPNAKKSRDVIGSSLDHLIGTWSEKDLREFERAVADLEQIDEELWR